MKILNLYNNNNNIIIIALFKCLQNIFKIITNLL